MSTEHRSLWRHQGLNFDAPFAMGTPVNAAGALVDVLVEVADPKLPGSGVLEPPWAEQGDDAPNSLYSTGDGYVIRIRGLCHFLVNKDATYVTCKPEPDADLGWLPLFMVGTVTSMLLTVRGCAVLHGSAVRWGEGTVLFIGPTGQGKTTMAALACAAGAEFVTDDVAPLVRAPDGTACWGLSQELRLRESAGELLSMLPLRGPTRQTKDGRLAARPRQPRSELNRVSAVVLPRPVERATHLATRRLTPAAAVAQLLANARSPACLSVTATESAYFRSVSELAARVPVVEAFVPWGPPYPVRLVAQLLDELAGHTESA
jgi:hypothetical protein